jgi:hypothetical protein
MLIFAAAASQATFTDKFRAIPAEFWWKVGLGLLGTVALVVVLRKAAKTNKVLLGVGIFLFATIVGFNWIYERNEPAWASPAVQWLAGFFPTKGKVTGKS